MYLHNYNVWFGTIFTLFSCPRSLLLPVEILFVAAMSLWEMPPPQ